ncbi:hypothetical protein ACFL6M_05295 [Candidatus Eisenbacteria bacterium]|uniref:Glycosyltransferase RgtA/B/C/D-like domain-containing protein n=1 Tax=Eiseniibacteriota bacterium TaxID=2212470 RepID=A0ABV6YKY2_UNCEI
MTTEAGSTERRWRLLWLMLTVLLAAAAMRFYALGRESLWCDEAYTAFTIRLPLGEMITQLVHTDDAPPLFYLLQKLSTALAGDSESGLRIGPAVMGFLAVVILLGRALHRGSGACGWSAAFLAVATYGVFHARQARSYVLLILLGLVFILCAKDMLFGKRRAGPLLAVGGILLWMTHHVAVVLVLTSLFLWPLGGARRPRLRSWILWHAAPLVTWVVYWIAASSQLAAHAELNVWTTQYWQTHHLGFGPLYSLGVFLPGGLPSSEVGVGFATPRDISSQWAFFSAALGLVCFLAAIFRRRGPTFGETSDLGREIGAEVVFLLVPLLVLLTASLVMTPVYVLTRTDAVAFPAFVLLMGRGLASLRRNVSGGILFFWFLISLYALAPSYGLGNEGEAKGIDRQLAQNMAAGGLAQDDWVVHTFMTAPSIEYYLERMGAAHRVAYFPKIAGRNTASAWPTPVDSLQAYMDEAAELRLSLEETLPEDGAVWVFCVVEPSAAGAIRQGRTARTLSVDQIGYPVSALVYNLVGTKPVKPVSLHTQDWIGGHRAVLWIPRESWVPQDTSVLGESNIEGGVRP